MRNPYLVWFFVICLLLSIFILSVYVKSFENYKSFCILLTTCVKRKGSTPEETSKMLEIYKRSIDKWLETDLPIVVVDSSNYDFKEYSGTKLRVCKFICEETDSSSVSETLSILHATNNCHHMQKYTHIIKITGRYYIDNFSSILKELENKSDLYLQDRNDPNLKWQHSEIFGFKKCHANDIFMPIIRERLLMEKQLWNVSHNNKYIVKTFPKMPNVLKVSRGGDGLLLDPL